ncbi:hypothetical protein ACIP5Y_15595 [Nocardia sp. NPDC088792]|uniref:LtfC-like domain-containing protein n=1 Tax=Nocardia sp. NPDC088792 TaxID=3364332 RepID=UPI0038199D32
MTSPTDPGYLGYQPIIEPLTLTTGASFVQTIQPLGPAFAAGTTVTLQFTDPSGIPLGSWPATVTSAGASWNVPNATCDAIPGNSRYSIMVGYPGTPVTTYPWYMGTVVRLGLPTQTAPTPSVTPTVNSSALALAMVLGV